MPTRNVASKHMLDDLKDLGRKLEDVGRKLATATGRTVKTAAGDTLDVADDALVAARKRIAKVRAGMKKSV